MGRAEYQLCAIYNAQGPRLGAAHNGGYARGWLSRTPGHVGGSAARARSRVSILLLAAACATAHGRAPAAGAVAAAADLGQDWQDSCRGITIDLAQPGREWLFSCPQIFQSRSGTSAFY
jgi:hypothetical protein